MIVRGMALPRLFERLISKAQADASLFDFFRIMGAVPASASNLYKLYQQSLTSYIIQEVCTRLFIGRMAARFGAKIVPFGVVGEDDVVEVSPQRNDANEETVTEDISFPVFLPKIPGRF
ncbi:hypothetical protein Ddye_004627 [Dipteronia dyeriana]|uniref:Uncharacterized protein n=1 Tax=Dipteronia dyeriana TaxID=168575 RepID=A0AAD9XWU7_9ROSI|nr:hypothetical protein Ddye_004627 [Dipteronia dyeriana]